MTKKMKSGGLLALGVFAVGLALARPAVASDSAFGQPRAEQTIAKAQAAREAMAQSEAQTGQPLSRRQQQLLTKADLRLERATRYHADGRFEEAARFADEASRLIAKAWADPVRGHGKTKEVQ